MTRRQSQGVEGGFLVVVVVMPGDLRDPPPPWPSRNTESCLARGIQSMPNVLIP
jgi:hypothetical protein